MKARNAAVRYFSSLCSPSTSRWRLKLLASTKRQSLVFLLDQVHFGQFLKTRKRERSRSEESFEKQVRRCDAACAGCAGREETSASYIATCQAGDPVLSFLEAADTAVQWLTYHPFRAQEGSFEHFLSRVRSAISTPPILLQVCFGLMR